MALSGILAAYGAVQKFAGGITAGRAAKIQGRQQKVEKEFEAGQFEQEATQSVAAAQRNAFDDESRANLIASRALAFASAGGGGSDPTIVKIISDIHGEGAYRAAIDLYQGEDQARRNRMAAQAKRYEGAIAERGGQIVGQAYNLKGGSELLKGASSLYAKYGDTEDSPYRQQYGFGDEFNNPDDYG